MGTHPIFESDFDCLTVMSRLGMKGSPLPGGPAGAFVVAGAVLGVVYVFFKYVSRGMRTSPRTLGPDPNKTVTLPLVKVTEVSHDTKIFRFGLPEGNRLGLPVGQHVNVKARINDKLVIRSYTPISSDDDIGYVDLLIKVYLPNERFPEGGQMTQYMNAMKVGETLDFVGPKGRLIYQRNGKFLIRPLKLSDPASNVSGITQIGMIAGGSGITPMLQIVRDVFKSDEQTKIKLLFANQTEADILLREEIEDIQRQHPTQFSFMYTVDRPPAEGWKFESGFINQDMIEAHMPLPSDQTQILICGPPPMVKFACMPNLEKAGHAAQRIFVY